MENENPVLAIDCSIREGNAVHSVGKKQHKNLAKRGGRRYVLAEPLSEYEKRSEVILVLRLSNGSAFRVEAEDSSTVSVFDDHAAREKEVRIEAGGRARHGVRREELRVVWEGISYPLTVTLPFEAENLDREQYDMMLDDISHWIHLSLGRQTEHSAEKDERSQTDGDSLQAQIATFELLKRRIGELESVLQRIASAPERNIEKEYVRTRHRAGRSDARTIRWNEMHADAPGTLTYQPNTTYDVYENRFILFLLNRLGRLLGTLRKVARRTREDKQDRYRYKKRKGWDTGDVEEQKDRAEEIVDSIDEQRSRLSQMEAYPFLREVDYNPSQFKINFSLALTQDINYARVFSLFEEFREDLRLQRLDQVRQFTEGLVSLGVKKTSTIYEYWTFFATYQALNSEGLGFRASDGEKSLLDLIARDVLTPGLKQDSSVRLRGTGEYEGVWIDLNYERGEWKTIGRKNVLVARPDVTLSILKKRDDLKQLVGRFMLDAKYKTFEGDTSSDWGEAVGQTEKYQSPEVGGKIEDSLGAFLMHVNATDGSKKEYNGSAAFDDKRWHGWIPVLPGDTNALKVLLKRDLFGVRLRNEL